MVLDFSSGSIAEEEFDQVAVHLVQDQVCDISAYNRAKASLPRYLILKPPQTLSGVSIHSIKLLFLVSINYLVIFNSI